MLETLASYRNTTFYATSGENAVANGATILLCVLSAGALAATAANYEPSSYDDAILMLNRVCDTLDEVLLMAADAGDDDDYLNLLQTRDALVNAYSQKGAVLGFTDPGCYAHIVAGVGAGQPHVSGRCSG